MITLVRFRQLRYLPVRSIHVCVVGSGPSAMYTAKYLLRDSPDANIDIIERLPTPFGLVRSGVAPDHPETKNVTTDFQAVLENDRCNFFGNVEIDREVSVPQLLAAYDAVVVASGAGANRPLNIPGEHLANSVSALAFVNWYNGHPDHIDDQYNLRVSDAVIIGNGNVAIDIARILSSDEENLKRTDIADYATAALQSSEIERVHVVARRGAPQASFTSKMVRELISRKSLTTFVNPNDLDKSLMTAASREECDTRVVLRKMQVLRQAQSAAPDCHHPGLYLRFLLNPVEIIPDANNPRVVGGVAFERTRLEGKPGSQFAVPTGEFEIIKAGLVVRSVGYTSLPFQGLPFDTARGVIPNRDGRVILPNGEILNGAYVVGWAKRGATGIIASNIADAQQAVDEILVDIPKATATDADRKLLWKKVTDLGTVIVDKHMWRRINEYEEARGKELGKPRVKLTAREELIIAASTR